MTAWHPCDRGQAGWNSELKNVFGRISKEGFAPFGVRVAFTVCNFLTHIRVTTRSSAVMVAPLYPAK